MLNAGQIKGYVRGIFYILIFKSKREHFWNYQKCILFHFKSSLRSWYIQILEFYNPKCYDILKWLSMKQEIRVTE